MKGHLFHRWMRIFPQLVLTTGLMLWGTLAIASSATILIIKSSDNSFFNTSIEQLINQTRPQVKFHITTLNSLNKDNSLLSQADLIITLGQNSIKYPLGNYIDTPVIHSYITEFQYQKYPLHDNHYSILLDQPLHRYVSFIKQLLRVESIGIIKNKTNKISPWKLNSLKSTLDVRLEQYLYQAGDNPLTIVRDLLQANDVLLSLPDPEVYNRKYLKGILLTSYRQNKPMISYSPAHVKSGALAAIFSSPENIGNQIAELLNKLLEDKHFKPDSHYYASQFNIKINHRVARSLGLKLSDKKQVLNILKSEQSK